MDALFDEIGLPRPARISNVFGSLEGQGYLSRTKGKGTVWRLTPTGTARSNELFTDVDLAALVAETVATRGPSLGSAIHTVVPPSLAPPELISGLQRFLAGHPFELNVFAMTRFPDMQEQERGPDPVGEALVVAREACSRHGLELHLASDRAISDDLWTNVSGHMWASKYGVAFFEDRRGRRLNYNLTIEVGGMLITGRRCGLLKDTSIKRLPTDLVGRIYKDIDLDDMSTVRTAMHSWIRDDLGLGACGDCS